MIPQEIIDNEDQKGLDALAAELGIELDHRKKFMNQVNDVKAAKHAKEVREQKEREEALRDPRNWEWKEGFSLHRKFGIGPNGGVYLVDASTGLEFFVPAEKIGEYRTN